MSIEPQKRCHAEKRLIGWKEKNICKNCCPSAEYARCNLDFQLLAVTNHARSPEGHEN